MKGKCEIFENGRCFGCIGLAQDNIDELKNMCNTYREETDDKNRNTTKITKLK